MDQPDGATPIDADEYFALIPPIEYQHELNQLEQENILEAVRWADTSRQSLSQFLTEASLRNLHLRMFKQVWRWAGKYRHTQKNIGVPSHDIAPSLTNLCLDVKAWIEHETYPPDEIAARFHHRLVFIHPFPNGNGRHARLATDLLLKKMGGAPFTWGRGDLAASGEIRNAYLAALRKADNNDFQPLQNFVRS